MQVILLVQFAVLVALVAWLAVAPPRSNLAFAVQGVASLLALLALIRVGVWLFPPWWAPHAALIATLGTMVWRLRHRPGARVMPDGAMAWLRVAGFSALGVASAFAIVKATSARSFPGGDVFDLALPFDSGSYLVVNGGSWQAMNAHRASVSSADPRFRPWRGNGWAVDLVAIDHWGLRASGFLPSDPASYRIFGARVVAPCEGTVVLAEDGRPDMRIPEYDRPKIAGNHVILDCAGVHIVLAHLRNGSVLVRAKEHVRAGQPIGEAGNSGGTDEPHLHIHAQRPGPAGMPVGGDPLPIRINGRFLVRGDRIAASRD